ncbi:MULTISPECIES: amidohydrolase family protein [Bradyrhizobium]|uniref:amidohydrolase family protein n=1 Tax=Bradyrhizobium centrosematis TaxID=1300039 RepID=UPI002167C657|nr:amidohydrolase family protein [Bradyrhizobium centrosematis]MCS3765640.1 putative TIM-barrel fold metal-dependent hydrolase [Bradyrhizobium centrosematis]MCS3778174.1 putative TIM-barrel fold metal-dependent hydrolase [Bradyrhizobium centrosematis]
MENRVLEHQSRDRQPSPVQKDLLIDTDVHESLRSGADLLPYLPLQWKGHITERGWKATTAPTDHPYPSPSAGPGAVRKDWLLEDRTYAHDLQTLQRHLFDGEGVTHAILNGMFYPSTMKGGFGFAAALASAYNDWQIDNWLDRDDRFRGSIHLPPADDPAVAVQEIERKAYHPGFVQVFLPSSSDVQWGDPRYHIIYETALKHQLVVTFHHSVDTRTGIGWPRTFIEWHTLAAPQAAMNQIASLIFNGVFDKFPGLKVVFLEPGVGWVPWFMWRADQQYREVRLDVPWVKRLPSEYMQENVRFSTQPFSDVKPEHMAQMIEWIKADRMFMFATDYPHYDADSADYAISPKLPAALRERIRYRNALETYPRLKDLGR